jgi:hypothetical protein
MPNPKVALVGAIAVATLVLPGAAAAQIDPGVNYDPGSPAGKEYAIPLVEGRSDGAGTSNFREGANIPFGVGISPPGDREGASRGTGGTAGGESKRSGDSTRGAAPGARPGESSEELAARIAQAEEPDGTAGRTILLALAVLLPASLLALLLMQRAQASRTGRTA